MATKTLNVTADVSISEKYSGNAYNSSDRLAFGVGTGSTDEYYALLKFGSLGLDTGAYNITSAKLTVTKITGALGYNADFNAIAQRITSTWSESTTWSGKPSTTTTGQSAAVAMGTGHSGSVTFDVTSIVQAWADGSSQYGILLKQNGTTASRIKCIGDRTSSSAAKLVVTYENKTTKATAPSIPSSGSNIITPNGSVKVTWSGAKGGTNNSIESYQVYWKVGSAPTTSSYTGTTNIKTTATSGSTTITLSNAARGSLVYVGIVTRGSAGSSYYSSITTAPVATINSLPAAPTVKVDKEALPASGGTVTFTVTAGSDSNSSQTKTLYYSTSSSGTKTKFTSLAPKITSTTTYYFYTYDGLEYSSATTKKITLYAAPSAPTVSVSSSTLSSKGGTVTFTVTAGKSNYGTASLYYSTSSFGTKTKFTSPLSKSITSTTTYYFYTYDGLGQYSGATTQKVTINTVPVINSITVTPTILTPSSTQAYSLVNKVSLACTISKTPKYYGWYIAIGSSTTEVNNKIADANNRVSTGTYANVLTKISSSASGTFDLSSTVTKGYYYQVGLIVNDGLDSSAFKWWGTTYQNPLIPSIGIESIICTDDVVLESTKPSGQYEKTLELTTTAKTIGIGYPAITSCVPIYLYTSNTINGSNVGKTGTFTNYENREFSNKITFIITTTPTRGTIIQLGIKYTDSGGTEYKIFNTQNWMRASAASFSSNSSIDLENGDNNDPVRPYSIKQFKFNHPIGNNVAIVDNNPYYKYKLSINGTTIDIDSYLTDDLETSTNVTRYTSLTEWNNFNNKIAKVIGTTKLNNIYNATLYVYPVNVFNIEGSAISKTVYFDYREAPSVTEFSIKTLTTPTKKTLTYSSTNGFNTSGGLINSNIQFQNGDTLTFSAKIADINEDVKSINLYYREGTSTTGKLATTITTNIRYNESIYITYDVFERKNTVVSFYLEVTDSFNNTVKSTKEITLYWTSINSPSAVFSIQSIDTDTDKYTMQVFYNNLKLGNSKITINNVDYNTLERYSLTSGALNKVAISSQYFNGLNWIDYGTLYFDYKIETSGLLNFNFSGKNEDFPYNDNSETASIRFQIKVIYDYNSSTGKSSTTNSSLFNYIYYFESPTFAYRKNRIAINTKNFKDGDIFVVKKTNINNIIRLVGDDSNGEEKFITINLNDFTIDGAIINGGTW